MHLRLKTPLHEGVPYSYFILGRGPTNHDETWAAFRELLGLVGEKPLGPRVGKRDAHGDLMMRTASGAATLKHDKTDHRRVSELRNFVKPQPPDLRFVPKHEPHRVCQLGAMQARQPAKVGKVRTKSFNFLIRGFSTELDFQHNLDIDV